jgi:hypothetical protein
MHQGAHHRRTVARSRKARCRTRLTSAAVERTTVLGLAVRPGSASVRHPFARGRHATTEGIFKKCREIVMNALAIPRRPGAECVRQESIHPRERATAGRWWAGDGAAAGRRQARVGAAAGRLQTRGHWASTPLRLAIARRPAGLKRGRWRESALVGGGTHPCAATLAPAGSSPGLRRGRRERRCGLLRQAA